MQLKQYQIDTLSTLRKFLENCRIAGPQNAFNAIVNETEQKKRLGSYYGPYRPLPNLGNVPYCCLRLPTGGGKTILGAYAIKVAQEAWIEKDYPVVLWLVPSNTIRTQTVDALKKPAHPYRAVLDEAFEGRVRVFDIVDFETIRPSDMRDNLCLIVGTIQTLRVNNTEGRKVYAHHEALEPHFAGVPNKLVGLEQIDVGKAGAGTIKFSLANLLHMNNPLMIVDEAHGAVTGLTQDIRERVNPCAVIEFTATPQANNNTLHNVKASELQDAEMIKLPIVLGEHQTWQEAVDAAIQTRSTLEEEAKGESQYVRPLVLFQAEDKGRDVTVEVLRQYLLDSKIGENQIAVATGDQRDLDSIDLFSRTEPVRFIITKEALKEGWDCSFAYVFCSVANVSSATDVEQLLGRVMRMPYATRRKSDKLNRAYAHVPETKFGAAAEALRDKLVSKMGFEQQEAENVLVPSPQSTLGGSDFFGRAARPRPMLDVTLRPNPVLLEKASALLAEGVQISQTPTGAIKVVTQKPLNAAAKQIIARTVSAEEAKNFAEAAHAFELECQKELSPAELGATFIVPALAAWVQDDLIFVDPDTLLDDFEWSIADTPARLEKGEFDVQDDGRTFEIFLDGERMSLGQADAQTQLPWDAPVAEWTAERLAIWLDKQNHDAAFSQSDMLNWTTELVRYLTVSRGFAASQLYRLKFILSRKVAEKITAARKVARDAAHQKLLFGPQARVELSLDFGPKFHANMYFGQPVYNGPWQFKRSFLGPHGVGAFDGQRNLYGEGEEFDCAKMLDSLPQVKHWVRNIARHPNSFKLPLAQSNFYPDFVAELQDGGILVVEYKGELTIHAAEERRTIGEKWQQASTQGDLFVIVEKEMDGLDMRAQLQRKIGSI
jgi:type III restriction enzyme